MKAIQQNPHISESLSCILNMSCEMDLSPILFNTSRGTYQIPKNQSKQL